MQPPNTKNSELPLENTESLCGSLCCVTRLRSRMTRTRERGGVKGKFSRGNYRKHLEEFRVSFKFTTGSVRHTPPQSTESAESRNLRKLSNGGTVLEIRSPKKSSAAMRIYGFGFISFQRAPSFPAVTLRCYISLLSVQLGIVCKLQILPRWDLQEGRRIQFNLLSLHYSVKKNKEGLLLCHAAAGAFG